MEDWFTVEKIDNDTFAISEYGHYEETHCYLLCGTSRAVLIDTGLGIANIRSIAETLTNLPITVFTTHVHWDHIGGHRYFDIFAVHKTESNWISQVFPLPLHAVKQNLTAMPCRFPEDFSLDEYQLFKGTPSFLLHDGDRFDLGGRTLTVIHTPGHSPGHCCFYEDERKYLYTGDLIYKGTLDMFYPTTDPILFRQSVKKLSKLAIIKLLPGHHTLDIHPEIISHIEIALDAIANAEKLYHGSGIFDYGNFQIRL